MQESGGFGALGLALTHQVWCLAAGSPDREGESWTRTLMRFENGQVATLEMGGYPGAFYVRRTRPNSSLSSFASLLCSLGAVSVSVAQSDLSEIVCGSPPSI